MGGKCLVYADNAATTKISGRVFEAMLPYLRDSFGNPSGIYRLGREARKAVETAREQVAAAIGAAPGEVIFTSGGTESDNWAIKMAARAKGKGHVITSALEHHAVLNCVKSLREEGFDVTYIGAGEDGIIDPADVEKALRPDTALVSIMYANNETGVIQPVEKIGGICRKKGVIFHTDAVQAAGNVRINVKTQNIDLLSISGHKLRAPKGIGALYALGDMRLPAFIHGGGQEKGMRAGTENVASITGFGVAVSEAVSDMEAKNARIRKMRDRLLEGLLCIPRARLNGCAQNRLPGNINLSFEGIESEAAALLLDLNGISVSSGSACSTGTGPSHVLMAMGLGELAANSALRITLNEENSQEDVDYILDVLPGIIKKLREQSQLWKRLSQM